MSHVTTAAAGARLGSNTSAASWLPYPAGWSDYARAPQESDRRLTLARRQAALTCQRALSLGSGSFSRVEGRPEGGAVAFASRHIVTVANFSAGVVVTPEGEFVLQSADVEPLWPPRSKLSAGQCVWLRVDLPTTK